jgi:hypothetical protein
MFRLALLAALIAAPAFAQCRNGSCAVAAPAVQIDSRNGWFDAGNGWLALYHRGSPVGWLEPTTNKWQTYGKPAPIDLIETFHLIGAVKRPPMCVCANECKCKDCPRDCVATTSFETRVGGDDPFPGGVVSERIPPGETYDCGGHACSRQEAFQRLESSLADDRDKAFLTVVGDEGLRKKVLADIDTSPLLAPWKNKVHVNAYDPSHWNVNASGLAQGVSYQLPPDAEGKSKVQFRLRAYTGPEALATALRKADPNYRPDADPDPLKPKPAPTPTPDLTPAVGITPNQVGYGILAAIAGIAGIAIARKK